MSRRKTPNHEEQGGKACPACKKPMEQLFKNTFGVFAFIPEVWVCECGTRTEDGRIVTPQTDSLFP